MITNVTAAHARHIRAPAVLALIGLGPNLLPPLPPGTLAAPGTGVAAILAGSRR
ncbi:hypothetical protein ACFOY2_44320 [Nonomuraea purpurea]|uniref:Uncharacterized protein n=1 Tax=Nonomuraea purpurea TaxID=1849276 RepID=A0ABV8GK39_9ACTN